MGRCTRIQSYMSNGDWLNTSCDLLIGYWGVCMWCNDVDWLTREEVDSQAHGQCMIRACTLHGSEVGVDLWRIDIIHAIGGQIHMRCISNSSQSQLHSFNLLQGIYKLTFLQNFDSLRNWIDLLSWKKESSHSFHLNITCALFLSIYPVQEAIEYNYVRIQMVWDFQKIGNQLRK